MVTTKLLPRYLVLAKESQCTAECHYRAYVYFLGKGQAWMATLYQNRAAMYYFSARQWMDKALECQNGK